MKNLCLAILASGLMIAQPASAAELLINGGFDGDSVAAGGYTIYSAGDTIGGGGWTVLGGGGNSGLTLSTTYAESGIAFTAQAGPVSADLTAAGNTGFSNGIQQTVATAVGQVYRLSFYVGNADGTFNGNYVLPSSITATVGGAALGTFTNAAISSGGVNWQFFTQDFAATSTSTVIQFNNATSGADNFAGLDTVSLSAVPEASTWGMMLLGFGLVGMGLRSRRKPTARITYA